MRGSWFWRTASGGAACRVGSSCGSALCGFWIPLPSSRNAEPAFRDFRQPGCARPSEIPLRLPRNRRRRIPPDTPLSRLRHGDFYMEIARAQGSDVMECVPNPCEQEMHQQRKAAEPLTYPSCVPGYVVAEYPGSFSGRCRPLHTTESRFRLTLAHSLVELCRSRRPVSA